MYLKSKFTWFIANQDESLNFERKKKSYGMKTLKELSSGAKYIKIQEILLNVRISVNSRESTLCLKYRSNINDWLVLVGGKSWSKLNLPSLYHSIFHFFLNHKTYIFAAFPLNNRTEYTMNEMKRFFQLLFSALFATGFIDFWWIMPALLFKNRFMFYWNMI